MLAVLTSPCVNIDSCNEVEWLFFQKGTKEFNISEAAMVAGGELQAVELDGHGDAFDKRGFINMELFDPFSTGPSKHIAITVEDFIQLILYS